MNRPPAPPSALLFFATIVSAAVFATQWSSLSLTLWTTAVSAALASVAVMLPWLTSVRRHALVVGLSLLVAHAAVVAEQMRSPDDQPLQEWLGEERISAEIEVEILDGPIDHGHGMAYDAKLTSVDIDEQEQWTDPPPRIRLFYPTRDLDPCARLPLPGDRGLVWADLQRFAPAHVPWRTSHRTMMERRGYTASATAGEPMTFVDDPDSSLRRQLRRRLAVQRIGLERRVSAHVDGDAEAVAVAMLTGSRGKLDDELREPFDITSTGHILAISGLHFATIAALVVVVIRLFTDRFPRIYRRIPRRFVVGSISLVVLALYLIAIGAPVSARRAFTMIALGIGVVALSPWRLRPLSALAVTAGLLVVIRPSLVLEPGYQLSVTATGGILVFLRYRPSSLRPDDAPDPDPEPRRRRWMRRLLVFGGCSISATLATWPILWRMTGELPVAGLWTNLVVVPVVGSLLFPLLVAGAVATYISTTVADLVMNFATDGLMLVHAGLDYVAYAPGAVWRTGTPSTLEWIGALIGCAVAIIGGLRVRAIAVAITVAALCCVPGAVADKISSDRTEIHFIYVGQGDATLVEFPDDTTVLIDGGGRPVGADPGLRYVVPYLRHQGIDRLDAVIVTHGDYDHYGGLFATIRPFRPRRFFVDPDEGTGRVTELRDEMAAAGARIEYVDDRATIDGDDVTMTVYRPDVDGADPNDRSLTARFDYAGAGVLLAGDLEAAGESWLVENLPRPKALVKAPHHGSDTSSTPEFLHHFAPAVAVSSSGRHNRFGHPDPEVVDRYDDFQIDLFRTDTSGSVVAIIDDDGTLRLRPARPPNVDD